MSGTTDNADQIAFWNGVAGERWTQNQAQLDAGFVPLTEFLLSRAAPREGEAALDIGCGCGDTTLRLARALGPQGRVLAADVSEPMLALARARAEREPPGAAPIEWALGDAATTGFSPDRDLLVSRFGVMFFADPVAAFKNLRGALKPGGRLAMLCWRTPPENPWFAIPRAAVLPLVTAPEPAPPEAPGPFAFADSARVLGLLASAGFAHGAAERFDAELMVSSAATDAEALALAARFSLQVGPAGSLLRDASDATMGAARLALEAALKPHVHDGRVALRVGCWLYSATA